MYRDVKEYLKNKEYNIMFERLLMMFRLSDGDSKFDNMTSAEKKAYFGNLPSTRVYAFTNEYMDGFFDNMDLTGKRAFVVGSSGDQALHCVACGASEVTIADANMWTKPFVELKMAAIKNLSFYEFYDYMTFDKFFDHKYYRKVSHDLSEQSRAFWDSIMLEFGGSSVKDVAMALQVKSEMFQYNYDNHYNPDFGKAESGYYLNKESFENLKQKLDRCKIDIKIAEFEEFPSVAEGKYDLIMLSNIRDYVKENEFMPILEKLSNEHLTQDGKIQAHYLFGMRSDRKLEMIEEQLKAKNLNIELVQAGKASKLRARKKPKRFLGWGIEFEKKGINVMVSQSKNSNTDNPDNIM